MPIPFDAITELRAACHAAFARLLRYKGFFLAPASPVQRSRRTKKARWKKEGRRTRARFLTHLPLYDGQRCASSRATNVVQCCCPPPIRTEVFPARQMNGVEIDNCPHDKLRSKERMGGGGR